MTVSTYTIMRTVLNTEQGEVRAASLEDAWEIWHAEGRDLLSPHCDDQEETVQIVEDVKHLNPTGWDEASCPRCGDNECIEVEDQTGTHEFFTAWANCCSIQWVLFDLASAAKCDPAWKDVG